MSSHLSYAAAGAGQTVSSHVPASSSVLRPAAAGAGPDPFDFPVPSPDFTMSSKYVCIVRPCQSGKTRTMQELMLEYDHMARAFYPEDENFVNILICSKNLNLVKQTHARMKKDLFSSPDDDESDSGSADDKIEGDIFSWMTGTKDTNITAGDLFGRIILEDIRMVICCAHKKRLEYVSALLSLLDRCKAFKQRVNIWMDEADDYVNLWSEIDFSRHFKINKIHLVSATIDSIVDKHKRICVKPMRVTFPSCYHKTTDSVIEEVDTAVRNPVDYLKTVYALHKETLNVPGMRLFAPGDLTVKSHNEIAEFLLAEGFAVCILNGRKKCILTPDREEPLNISDHVQRGEIMEVGRVIARMYRDYNLSRFPFAVTGKICLSRGITFNCEEFEDVLEASSDGSVVPSTELMFDFLFDAGVIPHMNDRATLYQCASRVNGNIRNFKNYKSPTLYMSSDTHQTILDAEKIASNLAVLVHTHRLADIGKEEMNWAIHGDIERYRRDLTACVSGEDMSTGPQIPEIVPISDEDYATIPTGKAKDAKRRIVLALLARTNPELAAELEAFECVRVNVPETNTSDSYKNSIGVAVRKFDAKQRCSATFKKDERDRGRVWQCFVDKHSDVKKLCFVYVK